MSIGNVLSLSGGKDSTALLLLAIERQASPLRVVFADTGHEHPATYDYVRYLEDALFVEIEWVRADFTKRMEKKRAFIEKNWAKDGVSQAHIDRALELLHPTGNPFLDLCLWKGRFPSTRVRFCTQELKHEPITTQVMIPELKKHDLVLSWQGVRRDESPSRAKLPDFDTDGELPRIWNYRPILRWTAGEVFAFHRRHGIEPNPLYLQGMGRVGCMPCIHATKRELREIGDRFPEEIERVHEWEKLVSRTSKQGITTFYDLRRHKGDADYSNVTVEEHGIHSAVEWSNSEYDRKQKKFIPIVNEDDGEAPSCSSIYGLCE